jgi:membrane-associated phospholipid phosphatase
MFNLTLFLSLVGACAVLMILEWRGLKTTLQLEMKGDVKRETRWLAQYGQALCTGIVCLLVFQLDRNHVDAHLARPDHAWLAILVAVLGTSIVNMVLKRGLSRVRPNRENAGKFLGPHFKHANWRESFPSSHSSCAVTLSVMLALLYPAAAATFWGLAIACAVLRYILDAHWPSDVLGGVALGYGLAHLTWFYAPRWGV